ncbi:MAG: metallophosphoesterase family protein [DPANN group archaeon]|nr:metallophosphoesterase family protein [DPANN group archaeon]
MAKKELKILCTADIHTDHKLAEAILNTIKEHKIDVYIGAGDFHSKEFTENFLKKIKTRGFVVSGNWDHVTFKNKYISSMDFGIEEHQGYYFFGVGNSIYYNFNEIAMEITKHIDPKKLIFITHYPPYKVLDKIWSGRHVGYPEFTDFIEDKKPALHVFGHIHEDHGHKRIGKTLAVNCSLADERKLYIISLPSQKITKIDVEKMLNKIKKSEKTNKTKVIKTITKKETTKKPEIKIKKNKLKK